MTQLPQEVKISAYLLFTISLLSLCVACPLTFVWAGFIWGLDGNNNSNDAPLGLLILALIFFIFTIAYGVVGYSQLQHKRWARSASISLAILAIVIYPPWSTLLGIIVLVLLFQKRPNKPSPDTIL